MEYILMHKDVQVALLDVDTETGKVAKIKEKVIVHSNITDPGELFRHATRTFISDNRTEEEAIYQANPVEVPTYINLVRSD